MKIRGRSNEFSRHYYTPASHAEALVYSSDDRKGRHIRAKALSHRPMGQNSMDTKHAISNLRHM